MKKLLFLALGTAFFATACSTKENQVNTTDVDSTVVVGDSSAAMPMDSAAAMPMDSAATMTPMAADSATVAPTAK